MEYLGRVAIITRTKNRTILLERAINSVLEQTFQDWCMVIVNDGGKREPVDRLVGKYCDQFKGRVAIIHNETSVGMEAASNLGIAYGDSEYIVIHDDDDSWAPSFLMMCLTELEQVSKTLPSVQGVITYSLRVLERLERGSVVTEQIDPYNKWISKGVLNLFRMTESNMFPPISFVYRRKALETIGAYREDLPVLGDWEFNLRFMAQYDIYVIPHALAFYHHRPSASNHLGNSNVAGLQSHEFYSEYLRNDLLRRDLRDGVNGLGTLMNVSWRMRIIENQVIWGSESAASAARAAASMITAQLSTAPGGIWTPLWGVASFVQFARSAEKGSLLRKFVKHWRQESPRRAFAVLTRYGYLAMGGK